MTIDQIGAYLKFKIDYLASIRNQKKIVIFAGSNGRYSHRCETVTELSGIACANLSIAAGLDLSWQLAKYWPYLKPGDVLYMPLEYWPLLPAQSRVGPDAPYVIRRDHAAIRMYWPSQLGRALFYFDVRYLLSGIGEVMLQASGAGRRTSVHTMTPQGDERGHDLRAGVAYREVIASIKAVPIEISAYDDPRSLAQIDAIVTEAKRHGVLVVGGLPTVFDDRPISEEVFSKIRGMYESRGACFIEQPNRSKYPRRLFFDTEDHLVESAQIAHSARLTPRLAAISHRESCFSD